jgi:hypothetical protein
LNINNILLASDVHVAPRTDFFLCRLILNSIKVPDTKILWIRLLGNVKELITLGVFELFMIFFCKFNVFFESWNFTKFSNFWKIWSSTPWFIKPSHEMMKFYFYRDDHRIFSDRCWISKKRLTSRLNNLLLLKFPLAHTIRPSSSNYKLNFTKLLRFNFIHLFRQFFHIEKFSIMMIIAMN